MNQSVQFGSARFDFRIEYSARKTIGITVNPEMEIIVKAPNNVPVDLIKSKVRHKAPWIVKQLNYFLSFMPKMPPKRFVGGESHMYMGRQYLLKVITGKREMVTYKGRVLEVSTRDKSRVENLLTEWYNERAKLKFHEIARPLISRFKKYDVEPSGLYIQKMSKRWGSCTPGGKIILNTELIRAPKNCIEYVIIHELCHLVYYDHTRNFIKLQKREMPDWEKWKNRLDHIQF
ncbi:MAG: SprT family zinc-dependent metalloprotease [Bacteroidota bacterium]